jgi:HD-GYP domain-containing protein (c-di-GMP phosphodiesterase class II)
MNSNRKGDSGSIRTGELHVSLFDLVAPVAKTVDMMCPAVADHHMEVAYLAFRICEELDLPAQETCDIAIAGALHDIGAFSLDERLDLLEFEDDKPTEHSVAGYVLLREFPPFAALAPMIKYHHVPWENGKGAMQNGEPVPRGSHLLHIADRVAVLIPKEKDVLGAVGGICETIAGRSGDVFVPEFVDAVLRLAKRDHIWLEATSDSVEPILRRNLGQQMHELDADELMAFSRMMCKVIDFKSEFTATHTSGLAATALALARILGFSEDECRMMQMAAYLHDLGKLAVPAEILEKPAKLTDDEWPLMRSHVYYTYKVLDPIDSFETVASWSSLHQERLDGSGYPFGYSAENIPKGARVMAVADVFTAITEDRPYRKGMQEQEARDTLRNMAERNELDADIVGTVLEHFDELSDVRARAQEQAIEEYREFKAALN